MTGMVSCREKCHLRVSGWNQIVVSSMNISLPETLSAFVRRRVAEADFAGPDDYVRHLIQEDERRLACAFLEEELSAGMAGPAEEADDADWRAIREEVAVRLGR